MPDRLTRGPGSAARPRPRHLVAFVLLGLGLGALAGVAWAAVVRLPTYTVDGDGRAATSERGLAAVIGSDAWFCALGAVAGLLLGTVAWRRLRALGWPVVLVGTLTAAAAGVLAWRVGVELGPGSFNARLAAARAGDVVPVALELRARASLLVWPFLAVVPILLGSSLGRDEDELAEQAEPPAEPVAADEA